MNNVQPLMVNLFKLVTLKDHALLGCVSIRLPLPGCLLDMFPEDVSSPTEDSSLHGGRVRSFKHERGSWATYVYLPCKTDTLPLMTQLMNRSITKCFAQFGLLSSCLHVRPSRGGVWGAIGGAALVSRGRRGSLDPAGGAPPQPLSDGGAPTPLDPALQP